jgi:hypothetical protein
MKQRRKKEAAPPTVRDQFPLAVLYFSVTHEPRLRMGDLSVSFIGDVFSPLQCLLDPILSIGLHFDQSLEIA